MVVEKHTFFDVEYGINLVDIKFKKGADLPSKSKIREYFKTNPYYLIPRTTPEGQILSFKSKMVKYGRIELILKKAETNKYRLLSANRDSNLLLGDFVSQYFLPFLFEIYPDEKYKTSSRQLSLFEGSELNLKK